MVCVRTSNIKDEEKVTGGEETPPKRRQWRFTTIPPESPARQGFRPSVHTLSSAFSARSGLLSPTSHRRRQDLKPAEPTMSLQVNLSSRELLTAYQNVVNANGIDWALFTYDKGSNDLKVQSTGDGGLEELEEEFSDGR